MSEKEYVLGTHREELERLGLQHRCWRAQCHEAWEAAGFAPGHALLDVGCGPGYASLDLAAIAGSSGRVTAVDVSKRFLDHLAAASKGLNVTTIERDVQALDLPEASHDGAWSRWLMTFVPQPAKVIAGVARALKKGGAFAIHEYVGYSGMRVGPGGEGLARLVRAITESWRRAGGEADVALRLPGLLEEHGFAVEHMRPISRVARPGSLLWLWPESFFVPYSGTLVEKGLLSEEERRAFVDEWKARSSDPRSIFISPTVLEIVARKK